MFWRGWVTRYLPVASAARLSIGQAHTSGLNLSENIPQIGKSVTSFCRDAARSIRAGAELLYLMRKQQIGTSQSVCATEAYQNFGPVYG